MAKRRTGNCNSRRKKNRQRTIELLIQYKRTEGCKYCKITNPIVLEFHHRDPSVKIHSVSEMINRGWSPHNVIKEVAKCDVLCANCHRILHYSQIH